VCPAPPPAPPSTPPTPPSTGGGALPATAPRVNPSMKAIISHSCKTPGTIALTFDDGPSRNIPALLAKLKDLDVKATFFVNAKNIANFVDPNSASGRSLKNIYDHGHQIGTHTFSHKDLAKQNTQQIWDEMRLNDEAIRRIIGKRPTHLRAPYLSTNSAVLEAVGSFGYKVLGVNLDTKDYLHNGKPNEVEAQMTIARGLINPSDSASKSFIALNHDHTSKVVQFTEQLIALGRSKGYRFVTTAECIKDPNPYRP
jgi:peptidoglycan/xylan/chitin deacetylase (PgdA/CDA1 family)